MATQEKLLKSLEILKGFINTSQNVDTTSRRKDKIQHCHVVTEAISNPTIKIAPNFSNLLSFTIEVLLQLCDDQESDVRMTAEECLNRIIRAMNDGNIGKVQIELHKEIRKNGSAKSLRAALCRFGQLAHLIRPLKGKPYVTNVLPSIIKICERTEEAVHETLASSLPKIMEALGCFTTETEVKDLLRTFLMNVSSPSATIRRTTAICMLSICLNTRKPYAFIVYCITNILDSLHSTTDEQNGTTILGVMMSLKTLIPNLKKPVDSQEIKGSFGTRKEIDLNPHILDRLLQIYEICMSYLSNKDHNVINASLDTLNVLLQNAPPDLKEVLCCKSGLRNSRKVYPHSSSLTRLRSPSQVSVATTLASAGEEPSLESELTDTLRSDIEQWIDRSELSLMSMGYGGGGGSVATLASTGRAPSLSTASSMDMSMADQHGGDGMDSPRLSVTTTTESYCTPLKSVSVGDHLEGLSISDHSSDRSYSCAIDDDRNEIDIGDISDPDVPLIYCTRAICRYFLLTGDSTAPLVSDRVVRVSVKSLALSCLAIIFETHPQAFLIHLDKNCEGTTKSCIGKLLTHQQVSDVLLFSNHLDPQLRGMMRIIVGNFLKQSIIKSRGTYLEWLRESCALEDLSMFDMKKMVEILRKGLEDESSNCTKQTISALSICLKTLTQSHNSLYILPILEVIPSLALNPYWLIKVSLCDLVSSLCYTSIYHIQRTCIFQTKVLHNVLFSLLGDGDQRVRSAAATAIVVIMPNLYFPEYQIKGTATTTKATYYRDMYLSNLYDNYSDEPHLNKKHFIDNMPFPYSYINERPNKRQEFALAKIISKLYHFILTSSSKYLMYGCIETLCLLCKKYPSTVYLKAWNCLRSGEVKLKQDCKIPDVLSMCLDLLSSSVLVYDLACHINILNIALNLYAGYSVCVLIPSADIDNPQVPWSMFVNGKFSELSETFLGHVVRLLNVFHHIVDETQPAPPHSKAVLPNLPLSNTLSPIKRRKSDLDKKMISPGKNTDKEKDKKEDAGKVNMVGSFWQSAHYMKIFEILRMSYTNYKISLEPESSEKFMKLLEVILQALSALLEVGTLTEFGRISEEILNYLKYTFALHSVGTVECVQQLLKCLFGTNLAANVSEILDDSSKQFNEFDEENNSSFYHNISQKPYNDVSICINSLNNIGKVDCDGDDTIMGYLHRRNSKQIKTITHSSDKVLANYIRIFEPMVIKSLKQYTMTSNIRLQCRVLQLLSQLVQLRVNYCLLDSDQVFIGFVLKQFEFVEEGQIPLADELIPKIFQFLVQLSYSRQHSKSIIGVPKIIQLCDGLMASGQPALTHCVPALRPVVRDVFLTRNRLNTADMRELEAMRDVLLSMLLRLLQFPDVTELVVLVLRDSQYYSDGGEKWLHWSKQVAGVLLPLLRQERLQISASRDLVLLRRLIFALHPHVFQPLDEVIVMLYQSAPNKCVGFEMFQRWLGKVSILLLILSATKEETMISKISELRGDFSPCSIFENVAASNDPLNVTNNADIFDKLSPEVIFIRFLFRVVTLATERIICETGTKEMDFIVEELSVFLMFCLHIFESGSHCKIANVTISVVNGKILTNDNENINLDSLNENFLNLATSYPNLVFKWCYLLSLIGFKDKQYWMQILNVPPVAEKYTIWKSSQKMPKVSACINYEIVRVGGCTVLCDYLSENAIDCEYLEWMFETSADLLVNLCDELPVFEFLSCLHRNPSTSGLVLRHIANQCTYVRNVEFRMKLLKCIENSHPSQTGALLCLLLPKMLNFHQVAVTRLVANLASRKIELLLTMSMEEVHNLLTREQVTKIIDHLVRTDLGKKHQGLVGLLSKLGVQYYDLSPVECDQRKSISPEYIKKLQINKKWFLEQIQSKLRNECIRSSIAELLTNLEYEEVMELMNGEGFSIAYLNTCLKYELSMLAMDTKRRSPLIKASVDTLLRKLNVFLQRLPKVHQVYEPTISLDVSPYTVEINKLFFDTTFTTTLIEFIPPVTTYVRALRYLPFLSPSDDAVRELLAFSTVGLELMLHHVIDSEDGQFNVSFVDSCIGCAEAVLRDARLCSALNDDRCITWVGSNAVCVHGLVERLLAEGQPLPPVPVYVLEASDVADPQQMEEIARRETKIVNKEVVKVSEDMTGDIGMEVVGLVVKNGGIKAGKEAGRDMGMQMGVVGREAEEEAGLRTQKGAGIEVENTMGPMSGKEVASLVGREACATSGIETQGGAQQIEQEAKRDDKLEARKTVQPVSREREGTEAAVLACRRLGELVLWLQGHDLTGDVHLPDFLFRSVRGVVSGLARLSPVNGYLLVPARVWRLGTWKPQGTGPFCTHLPPLPIELLQDIDVLEEFLFRITLLGWRTRQQFEETWMCLLSVLCESPGAEEGREPGEADAGDLVHASSLAVRAITALLLKTLCLPVLGNSNASSTVHVGRDIDIAPRNVSTRKLKKIHEMLQNKYEECNFAETKKNMNIFTCWNFEKHNSGYSYGQVSVRYFMIATKIVEDVDENCTASSVWKARERLLEESGLDVNSCIQFLLDFYTQLIKPPSSTHLRLLHETVRSIVLISDLFTDKYQFNWMLDTFLELSKVHSIEDELLHQYLILGICKAAAVVTPDMEAYETIKKLLMQYMKSSFLPLRISCLYGILYLLESCRLTNTKIGGISDELQLILPFVIEYVQSHFNMPKMMAHSEEHKSLVWSIVFYLIENVNEEHVDANFSKNMLQSAISTVSSAKTNSNLHFSLIKGLERLIVVKSSVLQKVGKQILNLALEKMKHDNTFISLLGIQLLLTYMYTDCAQHLENADKQEENQTNPEYLVQTVEKVSAIFECIKKGHVCEAEVLSAILPSVLSDFFSPADILTKVIGEFLSPQQPHPRLLSKVVFQVFEWATERRQRALLQDWVVCSLGSLTQTQAQAAGVAAWCLTCFFLGASASRWARALFPYVQARAGRWEREDRAALCLAAADFYRALPSDRQREAFRRSFEPAHARAPHLDRPFADLLLSL